MELYGTARRIQILWLGTEKKIELGPADVCHIPADAEILFQEEFPALPKLPVLGEDIPKPYLDCYPF